MRNASVDFFRYLFIINICLWHLNDQLHLLNHGYLAVEFFFVLSGYFLFYTEKKNPNLSTVQFVGKKYKRFYPKYIFAFLITAILKWRLFVPQELGEVNCWFDACFSRTAEILLIQATGFSEGGEHVINGPMWFLSSLIWSSAIIWATIRTFKEKAASWFLPIIIFIGYTYLLNNPDYWNLERHSPEVIFVCSRMIRGICGISLGYMIAYLADTYSIEKIPLLIVNIAAISSVVVFILAELASNSYDNYALYSIPFIIVTCFRTDSVFNKVFKSKMFVSLGKISFDMFLIHIAFLVVYRHFLKMFDLPKYEIVLLYIILITALGYLFNYIFVVIYKFITFQICKVNR